MGIAGCTSAGLMCVSAAFPGAMRGQATAIYFLVKAVAGMIIGPPLVGLIVDAFGRPGALRYAIPIATLAIAPIAIVLLLRLRRSFAHMAKLARESDLRSSEGGNVAAEGPPA